MFHSILIVAMVLLLSGYVFSQQMNDLDWPPITRQARPWTRWWWPGNAVDERNLTRELEQMHQAGIGGVEITPIYGIQGADDREIQFLSPQWIHMLRHVGDQAAKLDMGVDMATCTGWPFGGPAVTPESADAVIAFEAGRLAPRPSGMKVKRAAPGGAGLVLNPYSTDALRQYLRSFDHLPDGIVRCQFHDSFEYAGNWTDQLPARFRQLHGYDLHDRVAELAGQGDPDTVARVKSDYRQTLAQLHLEYLQAWVSWCHAHGFLARNQAHGAPGNLLDLYAAADIPETETFGSTPFAIPGFRRDPADTDGKNQPNPMITKFASSAAHVVGRPLVSCETLTWLREHFRVALWMAKPEIDQMFLAGVNHIFYHGTCYSPDDAAWPGWLFYASSEINPRDTLWRDLPAMNQYIAKCQSILQVGWPDNDVLLYWPIYDNWHDPEKLEQRCSMHAGPQWLMGTAFAAASRRLTDLGCGHDFISDDQLQTCASDGSQIRTSGGAAYRALVLPPVSKMPLATLEKIVALAEAGVKVIVFDSLPQDVPGLGDLQKRRQQFQPLVQRLKSRCVTTTAQELADTLDRAGVRRETFVGDGIDFIRRRHDQGHHYFIASLAARSIDQWIPLAVPCESAVILDPLTGDSGLAALRKTDRGAEIYLQLSPGQSLFIRTFASRKVEGQPWEYAQPAGQGIEITGRWQVDFIEGGPSLPASFTTDELQSWTILGDGEAQRFAGAARYRIEFDRPPVEAQRWVLDLGDVRESARVTLNGKPIGVAWCIPFRLSLGSELRDRANVLEIEVTNLPANRIRDLDRRGVRWRIFKEINFVNINYKPFDASDWPIVPSGLLGPVRLMPVNEMTK